MRERGNWVQLQSVPIKPHRTFSHSLYRPPKAPRVQPRICQHNTHTHAHARSVPKRRRYDTDVDVQRRDDYYGVAKQFCGVDQRSNRQNCSFAYGLTNDRTASDP